MPRLASPDLIPPDDNTSPFFKGIAIVALLCNILLGSLLWWTHADTQARITRLEALAAPAAAPARTQGTSAQGSPATRQDRVAFLLAAAGNTDESKRVLDAVSTPECVEMARALISRPAAGDRNAALDAVFSHIAASDPARAVALLDEVSEPTLRNSLAVRVSSLWIDQSPDAAARWVAASGENFLAREALDAQLARAAARWAAYDPEGATAFLAARPTPGAAVMAALSNASAEWGRKHPTAALTWAQNLPASDGRRSGIVQSILAGWAEREPARAATYVQDRIYDGGEGNELYLSAVGLIADRWARMDPQQAARWALNLPGRRARRDALRRVATAWTEMDPSGVSLWAGSLAADDARGAAWQAIEAAWPIGKIDVEEAWLSGLPASPDRDGTVALHAGKIAVNDPEKALVWARTINTPEFQARSIQTILATWERTDPTAARNWAAANSVAVP